MVMNDVELAAHLALIAGRLLLEVRASGLLACQVLVTRADQADPEERANCLRRCDHMNVLARRALLVDTVTADHLQPLLAQEH